MTAIGSRKARYDNKAINDKIVKQRDRILKNDLKVIMGTPEGQRLIYSLLCHCGTFTQTFSTTPEITAYNCGRQSVGQELWSKISNIDINILGKIRAKWFEMETSLSEQAAK